MTMANKDEHEHGFSHLTSRDNGRFIPQSAGLEITLVRRRTLGRFLNRDPLEAVVPSE
ncbi:MAG: hypothetical protein MZV64_18815 [Ignavibacteriales bacterium]|nr:hypothetical protein [Ignavibacteriales bacterium]